MKLNQRQLDALGHIVDHCQKASLLAARLGTLERLEAEWETRYAIVRLQLAIAARFQSIRRER